MGDLFSVLVDHLANGLVNGTVTMQNIDAMCKAIKAGLSIIYPGQDVDDEMVIRQALANYDVYVGDPSFLDNNKDHEEWLQNEKIDINWALDCIKTLLLGLKKKNHIR